MFKGLRKQWRDLTKVEPGKRFQNRYECRKERRRKPLLKAFYMLFGAAIFIAGLILMPAPGPGCLIALIGAGMLAEESRLVARTLDRAELKMRSLLSRARRIFITHRAAAHAAARSDRKSVV